MSNVRSNFKSQFSKIGLTCPLPGGSDIEDYQHLLKCNITSSFRENTPVKYDKLLSGNVQEQATIIKLLVSAEKIRDSLLENSSVP